MSVIIYQTIGRKCQVVSVSQQKYHHITIKLQVSCSKLQAASLRKKVLSNNYRVTNMK